MNQPIYCIAYERIHTPTGKSTLNLWYHAGPRRSAVVDFEIHRRRWACREWDYHRTPDPIVTFAFDDLSRYALVYDGPLPHDYTIKD